MAERKKQASLLSFFGKPKAAAGANTSSKPTVAAAAAAAAPASKAKPSPGKRARRVIIDSSDEDDKDGTGAVVESREKHGTPGKRRKLASEPAAGPHTPSKRKAGAGDALLPGSAAGSSETVAATTASTPVAKRPRLGKASPSVKSDVAAPAVPAPTLPPPRQQTTAAATGSSTPSKGKGKGAGFGGGGGGGGGRRGPPMRGSTAPPPQHGQRAMPQGPANCLAGKAFLITGNLTYLTRDEATDLIRQYGGAIKAAPSKNVNYCIVGSEPGPKKIEKIQALKLKQIDEDALWAMIEGGKATKAAPPVSAKPLPKASTSAPAGAPENQLWADKWKPKSTNELIGNNANVRRLTDWLKGWKAKWLGPNSKPGREDFRAALLSGPPGVGKSSAAALVAQAAGYAVVEYNASDTRSKRSLKEVVSELVGSHSLTEYFVRGAVGAARAPRQPTVLIMDEVDGMSAGDRGGMQQLIAIIKKTRVPIICMCNDASSPKVRSLTNHCLKLPWHRPTAVQILPRIKSILREEGIQADDQALQLLVESTHNDIRQILTMLQMHRRTSTSLTYTEMKERMSSTGKDLEMSFFDAFGKLIGSYSATSKAKTLNDRLDLFFVDFDILPLMVQDYAPVCLSPAMCAGPNNQPNYQTWMDLVAMACDSVCDGDILSNRIRSAGDWSLLPTYGCLSTVRPIYLMHGAANDRHRFPPWMGKNSTRNKNNRLLRQLAVDTGPATGGANRTSLRLEYLPALQSSLVAPLMQASETAAADAVDDVIRVMDEYHLSKDDWDFLCEVLARPPAPQRVPVFGTAPSIASKVRSAFTRKYNKTHSGGVHKVAAVPTAAPAAIDVDEAEPETVPDDAAADDAGDEGDDANDMASDPNIKAKKKKKSDGAAAAAKGKGKGKGKASRKSQ